MLPSSNFGQKKKTSLTNKITVRSLKISSPALDIHPFRPKLILMMSTFQVCGRNYVVTIQMKPFSFWVCEVIVKPIKWKLLSSTFLLYCLFSLSWAVQIVQTLESVNENLSCDQFGNFFKSLSKLLVASIICCYGVCFNSESVIEIVWCDHLKRTPSNG